MKPQASKALARKARWFHFLALVSGVLAVVSAVLTLVSAGDKEGLRLPILFVGLSVVLAYQAVTWQRAARRASHR
jgi:hypothetical protein